jgi:hypothetical protein
MWKDTNISEDFAGSIFKVRRVEHVGAMALLNVGILPQL